MKKIVIFDFDGVIVDSLNAYGKAVISVFRKHGFRQINSRESFLDLFDDNFFEGAVKNGISSQKIKAITKELKPKLLALQKNLKIFGGMRGVLAKLAQRSKIYIVTSNSASVVATYLKSQNIAFIEKIIGADKETSKVKKIERIKSKYPRHQIFYVGDTKGDMVEGKLAGVETIAAAWGWHDTKRLKKGKPDYIAQKPIDLLAIVKESSNQP